MSWKVLQGDVLETLATIEPGSVDCAVTSPPYWQLRSYLPKDHELKRFELGSEPTIAEYIANQVEVMRGVRNALAEHGTVWLNVGDTYAGVKIGNTETRKNPRQVTSEFRKETPGIDDGNLCLIPQRLMIALQEDGWYVRSVVIWAKPSPMPASLSGWKWQRCRVKIGKCKRSCDRYGLAENGIDSDLGGKGGADWSDCRGCPKCDPTGGYVLRRGSWRPTSSYEPVIMLAKSAKYFADGEPVKTPSKGFRGSKFTDERDSEVYRGLGQGERNETAGANLRDVWTIASESLHEKHYAAFPTKLVMQCLKASVSEKGYCRTCGKPWVRMVETTFIGDNTHKRHDGYVRAGHDGLCRPPSDAGEMPTKTIGWRPSCQCEDTTPRPGLVLDPFCGSGRTGVAARRLGLDFVGCELNPEYVAMAERRIEAALRHGKRAKQMKQNRTGLFDEVT